MATVSERSKSGRMTKHTDSSRSTDSGVSGNAQTGAKEIRDQEISCAIAAEQAEAAMGVHGTQGEPAASSEHNSGSMKHTPTLSTGSAEGWALAQKFHEVYERLAPSFGYETRAESAKPWDEVPLRNKQLMAATCTEILSECSRLASRVEELEKLIAKHSAPLNSADSASNTESSSTAKETRCECRRVDVREALTLLVEFIDPQEGEGGNTFEVPRDIPHLKILAKHGRKALAE